MRGRAIDHRAGDTLEDVGNHRAAGAVVQGRQPIVVQSLDGHERQAGQVESVDLDGLGVDRGLGLDVQGRPKGVEIDRVAPGLAGPLELEDGRAERDGGIASGGGLEGRSTAQEGHRRLRPDLADEQRPLFPIETPRLLGVHALGEPPFP